MTSGHYIRFLRESPAGPAGNIHITETDQARLRSLVALEQASANFELEHEIERAIVVDQRQVPRDVVTMNSRGLCRWTTRRWRCWCTLTTRTTAPAGFSVCAGIGTAILGYREGDAFDWRLQDRTCRIRIGRVLYQPEDAGDLHL